MPIAVAGPTVTSSTQIAPGIIVDSDINAAAAIAYSKLALGNSIVNADIAAAAAIVLSKLAAGTQGGVMYRTTAGVMTELPAGTTDYYLATQGAGADPIWKAIPAALSIPVTTEFEAAARFTAAILGGGGQTSNTYGVYGVLMHHGYTYTASSDSLTWQVTGKASTLYLGNPTFTTRLTLDNSNISQFQIFAGLGNPTVAVAGHTWTDGHAGFKIVKSGGVISLYATQADGVTETASAALATLSAGDDLDLAVRITSGTKVDYYYRVNGGAMSAATTLTTNLPAGTSKTAQWSFSTVGVDDQGFQFYVNNGSYSR